VAIAADKNPALTSSQYSKQASRASYLNTLHTLGELLERGVLPIINENDTTATEAFGTPLPPADTVRLSAVPLFVTFPAGYPAAALRHELRTLEPADGRDRVLLALVTAEPESAARAAYRATGAGPNPAVRRARRLIGGSPVEQAFLEGVTQEDFRFTADQAGTCRLTRTWFCADGQTGSVLSVSLNGGPEHRWDLSFSETGRKLNQGGIRESSLLLRGVAAGENRLSIRHDRPGFSAGWSVSPLDESSSRLQSTSEAEVAPWRSASR
jgi:hypothetical protein